MPRSLSELGLDSNCLSYVIDALEGIGEPKDALAEQKVALVRLFLYTPGTLWTLPTVKREFSRISDPKRRASHESWTSVLFDPRPLNNPEGVRRRADDMKAIHCDEDDRLVLAEAEDVGFASLLSYDLTFVRRLAPHARLDLTTPLACWQVLAPPKGVSPCNLPRYDNPLAAQTWWRW
jgi:hypothetical protein